MSRKTWMIIAASLILAGSLIFVGVMFVLKWDFTKLSTVRYVDKTYEVTEEFQNISIFSDTAKINFLPTDGQTRVECVEEEHAGYAVSVKDGTLEIKRQNNKKWYHYIGINFGSPKVTVYLPAGIYDKLTIDTNTSDISIPADFSFKKGMDITTTTGDVKSKAVATGTVSIKTSTGDIDVQNIVADSVSLSVSTGDITATTVVCYGQMRVKVTTGKTELNNVQCGSLWSEGNTGDLTLINVIAEEKFEIARSTGSVKLEHCDAAELYITTDTGNVTGSLRSNKVFITETDTGTIKVPESVTGGKCKITTDTGDIKITVE